MKAAEVHPILADIPLIVLNDNIHWTKFLKEQGIAINKNEDYIGWVADCAHTIEITSLGNEEVKNILLNSKLSQEDSVTVWLSYMILETSTQNIIEFWEEFCFASVDLLIFKTSPSNFVVEYFKYQGREYFASPTIFVEMLH